MGPGTLHQVSARSWIGIEIHLGNGIEFIAEFKARFEIAAFESENGFVRLRDARTSCRRERCFCRRLPIVCRRLDRHGRSWGECRGRRDRLLDRKEMGVTSCKSFPRFDTRETNDDREARYDR